MRIFQKWIAILSIPLAFEAVFIIVLLLILKRADLEVAKQVRSAIARTTVQEIVIVGDEVAFMVVQYACERDMRIFNRLNQLKETGNGLIEKLKSSCDPADARERKFVDTVQMSLNEVFSLLDRLKTDRDIMAKHFPVAEQAMLALMMKEKIGGVGYGIKELFAHQREVNDEIKKEHATTRLFLKLWVFLGILANIAISATLTIYFSRDTTRRIEALKENSLRLVLSKDLRPSSEGSDEIAELEEVFFEVATAMKDAFDRERANFNHAADAICAIDNSGRIIRLNEAFQNTFGYQDAEILQMHFVRLVSTDARDDFLKLLQDNQHPVERRELVLPMITSGGLTRDFSWSVVWVAGQNVYMCVGHDITEYRKLEQAKQEFAAMLSHDLRGPLTSIGGTFEILSAGAFGKIPEDLAPSVSQGQRSVKKLISLINELLDLEKIEAGEMTLYKEAVPVSRMIASAVDMVSDVSQPARVRVTTQETNLSVRADEPRVVRALAKLLANAIKNSAQDGLVTVHTTDEGESVKVTVIDRGSIIPQEQLERIFDRYGQKSRFGNLGGGSLGLSLCKAVVEAHGGTVGAESSEAGGNKLWASLPKTRTV